MSNIFIISAPSGCGKTSLVRELCNTYSFLEQTVSFTTRSIRLGEVDGYDYHFISKDVPGRCPTSAYDMHKSKTGKILSRSSSKLAYGSAEL